MAKIIHDNNISLLISIDGPRQIHDALRKRADGAGSYDDIMKSLSILKENDVPLELVEVTFTKMHQDMGYTEDELISFVRDQLGFERCSIIPCIDFVDDQIFHSVTLKDMHPITLDDYLRTEDVEQTLSNDQSELFNEMYDVKYMISDMYHDTICSVGYSAMTLFPDGKLYPCQLTADEKYLIGQYNGETFDFFEEGQEFLSIRRKSKHPICSQCWQRFHCRGCLGTLSIPNDCESTAERSKKTVLALAKLYNDPEKWGYLFDKLKEYKLSY